MIVRGALWCFFPLPLKPLLRLFIYVLKPQRPMTSPFSKVLRDSTDRSSSIWRKHI